MKIEDFLYDADCKLSEKLDSDLESNEYSEKDAHVASVLTRVDTGLNLAALTYNSKLLSSINIGVWGIFTLLTINMVLKII